MEQAKDADRLEPKGNVIGMEAGVILHRGQKDHRHKERVRPILNQK